MSRGLWGDVRDGDGVLRGKRSGKYLIHCVSLVMVSPGMAMVRDRLEESLRRLAGWEMSSSEALGREESDSEE